MLTGFTIMKKGMLKSENSTGLKEFYFHRVSRIIIPILFWNCIYGYLYFREKFINWVDFICGFILLEFNGLMWFLIPLCIIYIALPWFNILCTQSSRSLLKSFIIIGIFLTSFSIILSHLNKGGNSLFCLFPLGSNYLIMTAIGYYFGNYEINKYHQNFIYLLGIISALFMLFMSIWLIPLNYKLSLIPRLYLNLPCIFTAIAIFLFFKYHITTFLKSKSKKFLLFLTKWSSLSFGIYLIQQLWFSLIGSILGSKPHNSFLIFIIMYFCCVLSVLLIKKIPLIRKIV